MPITTTELQVDQDGWAYNATTTDATSGLAVVAAPGDGKFLVLKELHITTATSARAAIQSKASATATVSRQLGLLFIDDSGYEDKFLGGLRLPENEELDFFTSAAGTLQVFAGGYTV